MSLADRLRNTPGIPNKANAGCRSCLWLGTIDADTLALINEWIAEGHSSMQLHEIISTPGEDCPDKLLDVSYSAWRAHTRHHRDRWGNAKA